MTAKRPSGVSAAPAGQVAELGQLADRVEQAAAGLDPALRSDPAFLLAAPRDRGAAEGDPDGNDQNRVPQECTRARQGLER